MPLKLKVVGRTDTGLVRTGNEDCLHIDRTHQVFAVCDGMGGHQAGEVASSTASDIIRTVFTAFRKELLEDPKLQVGEGLPPRGELLVKSIRLANRSIFRLSSRDSSKAGMGTTVVALAFESDILSVAHVGDSRAYRIGENELDPLTVDHSWVSELQQNQSLSKEEANSFIGKNIITRALGVRENVEVDHRIVKVEPGDCFLLCSDGLCGFADDEEIFEVIDRTRDDLQAVVDNLVQMANDRGGQDNVTVLIVEVEDVQQTSMTAREAQTYAQESPDVLSAEDHWLDKIEATDVSNSDDEDTQPPQAKSGTNTMLMIGIFVAFAVVALLILYLSQRS